jgi:YgiT-type zinc finger domain-containing protein
MKHASTNSEICPRCEDGLLSVRSVYQDIDLGGSTFRVPNVQVEECRHCGFRSLSGREIGLFEMLLAPDYARVSDLISAIKTAGYQDMFLREQESQSVTGFGSREYVSGLAEDLRRFYLDNESHHIIEELHALSPGTAKIDVAGRHYTVRLPRLGEGENGVVYEYDEDDRTVLKLAKPRPYCRDHVKVEHEVTSLFMSKGIPVPAILECDPFGSFMVKEKLAGESLAKTYDKLGGAESPGYWRVRSVVEDFISRLMELFKQYPEAKISVSPNNLFIIMDDDACRCLLVDTGPAPFHDYSDFVFSHYWDVIIPQKIKQYKTAGYI